MNYDILQQPFSKCHYLKMTSKFRSTTLLTTFKTNFCLNADFYTILFAIIILIQLRAGKSMTDHSHTGWLGHYKVSHIYPLNTENEYVTVQSNNGYPHVVLINTTDDTLGWRTDGEFEVSALVLICNSLKRIFR